MLRGPRPRPPTGRGRVRACVAAGASPTGCPRCGVGRARGEAQGPRRPPRGAVPAARASSPVGRPHTPCASRGAARVRTPPMRTRLSATALSGAPVSTAVLLGATHTPARHGARGQLPTSALTGGAPSGGVGVHTGAVGTHASPSRPQCSAPGDVCGNGAVRQHPRWTAGCSRGRTFPWGGRGSPRDAGSGGGAARSLYRQHPRVVAEGTETAPLRRKDRQLDGGTELTPRPGPQEAPGYGGPYRPGARTEYSQARLVLRQILGFLLQSQRKANVRERDGRPGTRPARPLRRKHRAAAPGGDVLRPRSSGWRWEAHTSA